MDLNNSLFPVSFCKKILVYARNFVRFMKQECPEFLSFLHIYLKDKIFLFLDVFERNKNVMVKSVLIKRGKRNRIFLHLSAMSILTLGIIISPFISDSNLFNNGKNLLSFAQAFSQDPESLSSEDVFQTQESAKPRDKIVTYTIQQGDTIGTIAKRFDISEDTIRWVNELKNDNLSIGDSLKILPVSGVAHKVQSGDTVYSIAKKYGVNPQEIVDFPFNDFANPQTFSLVEGQMIIVPNGVMPFEAAGSRPVVRQTYIATGPVVVTASGFSWPIQGIITQYFSWYHQAIDIAAPLGTPITAAQNGKVVEAYSSGWNWGYGIHVVIAGDNGYSSLYAHMSSLNVGAGDPVVGGSTVIGWVGLTGRTTGPHLHFEIRSGSTHVNPLSILH